LKGRQLKVFEDEGWYYSTSIKKNFGEKRFVKFTSGESREVDVMPANDYVVQNLPAVGELCDSE